MKLQSIQIFKTLSELLIRLVRDCEIKLRAGLQWRFFEMLRDG